MQLVASRKLKIAYAIALLAAVLPMGLASSGWVALAMGGGVGIPYVGPIVMLLLGAYRVITVIANPQALISFPVKGVARVLRMTGVFALYIGAAVGMLNLLSRPLMALFLTQKTESGVEFFVAGMILVALGGIGVLGLLCFELSRLLGFEEHARSQVPRQI
ncbi:hypothetical protein ACO0LL_24455 [Undibacterium sp. TC4M20W]|uniref:hypothetical protein n=1 Tax=Undibacterium sp. TC4M20W TaxID=3413052 RepID=UPI003BF09C63